VRLPGLFGRGKAAEKPEEAAPKKRGRKEARAAPAPQSPPAQAQGAPAEPVLGEAFDFEDFLTFELLKARASEMDALVISEGAVRKMEGMMGGSQAFKYLTMGIIAIFAIGIIFFVFKSIGLFHF
jgi:hypothetical protein